MRGVRRAPYGAGMGQLGADVEALDRLGEGLQRASQRVAGVRDHLQSALRGVGWTGPDADRFRGDWSSTIAPQLGRAVDALRAQSATLQRQAREQRAASEVKATVAPVAFTGPLQHDPPSPPTPPEPTDSRGQSLAEIISRYQVGDGKVVEWEPPWPESLATDPVTITEQEAKMLDDIGSFGRLDFKDIHDAAFEIADERFPPVGPNGGRNDNHNDAFRHAFWNALLTQRFGEQWAKDYATAHEQIPGNEADREAMDLYNNELGRRLAVEHPDASPDELADLVAAAVRDGDAVVIDLDGDLAFSDDVPIGQTGEADDGPAPNAPQPNPDDDSDWAGGYDPGGADDTSGTTTSGQ
jgi:hypothetical protein